MFWKKKEEVDLLAKLKRERAERLLAQEDEKEARRKRLIQLQVDLIELMEKGVEIKQDPAVWWPGAVFVFHEESTFKGRLKDFVAAEIAQHKKKK